MISPTLYTIGLIILLHASYSSYERHQLVEPLSKSIIHETIYGVVLIIFALIYSIKNSPFYTVKGKVTNEADGVLNDFLINEEVDLGHEYLKPIQMSKAVEVIERIGVSNHEDLISRIDFLDVVKKRKEYDEWRSIQ